MVTGLFIQRLRLYTTLIKLELISVLVSVVFVLVSVY